MSLLTSGLGKEIKSDLQATDNKFFNDFIAFSTEGNSLQDVNLAPVAATNIKTKEVFLSRGLRSFIESKKLDPEEIKSFFLTRHVTHIKEFKDISSTDSSTYEDSTMLVVISSAFLKKQLPPQSVPGESYHRDGKGNPVSVKITLTTDRIWKNGQLNIIKPDDSSSAEKTILGKPHDALKPTWSPCLEKAGEAFLLNNRELYHAVVTPYSISSDCRRTILQERLNPNETFDKKFLEPFL
jgi:hypothetical protein